MTVPATPGEEDQASLIAALESGQASGEPGPLRRIDTHLSHVFVSAERVYKLSRARRHPFVDLSGAGQRRAAAMAELEVNRHFAPALYERVAPVTRSAEGRIALDGAGVAVDWAVVMRRIPEGAILDEIADAGEFGPDLAAEAAAAIARLHAGLPSVRGAGGAKALRAILAGLRRTEREADAALGIKPRDRRLFAALEAEIERCAPLIDARDRAGWTRRGHGDLHLANICRLDGEIVAFDALAFDAALVTADVLYDFAFLLMDLRVRRLAAQANAAMNRYWDEAGQPEEAFALVPAFMALRAVVRMAVLTEAGDLPRADRYRRLARRLLAASHPRLVAIGGLSGTGKSVLARAIAPRLPGPCGARILRTDVMRKTMAGAAPTEALDASAYAPAARAAVYREMAEAAHAALASGTSVIADATFQEAGARRAVEAAAGAAPFSGLWLRASPQTRIDRVGGRQGDASDATAAVAAAQSEPASLGTAWRIIAADGRPAKVAAEARRQLASEPPRAKRPDPM
jgi:aminoglycoside phosphotransferase family enzyme/predicted kinase